MIITSNIPQYVSIEVGELARLREEVESLRAFPTGLCSAHQIPSSDCRICNRAIRLQEEVEALRKERDEAKAAAVYQHDRAQSHFERVERLQQQLAAEQEKSREHCQAVIDAMSLSNDCAALEKRKLDGMTRERDAWQAKYHAAVGVSEP